MKNDKNKKAGIPEENKQDSQLDNKVNSNGTSVNTSVGIEDMRDDNSAAETSAATIAADSSGMSADAANADGDVGGRKMKAHVSRRERRLSRKAEKEQIIRIQELEELMRQSGGDVDPEKIVSMYVPHRKRRRIGAALLRMDKWRLILLGLLLIVCVLFIVAFMQEKMGNFTINLNRLELYRKGISIADTGTFEDATARLTAEAVVDATNISIDDIPEDVDDLEGSHNGKNYMAYTYYIRNAGKEDLGYVARVTLDSCAKGAEKAVRVAIWRNGKRIVYAAPAADGLPEKGCENFESDDTVCSYKEDNFLVGNVDKYTIVIWMEGDDPECVDSIIGGSVQFSMRIDADYDDDTSLLWKFITDIKDTLTGNKPINAAGNDAPNDSYYGDGEITWDNRRNKDDDTDDTDSGSNTTNTDAGDAGSENSDSGNTDAGTKESSPSN